MIPYGKQDITEDDIQAVIEVLKSDFLTQGPHVAEFEAAFAKYVGASFAIAVASGTAALHLSAIALGVSPMDKIITTPITFAASANCVRFCGGEVVFSDINEETYLLDIIGVRDLLEKAPRGTYKGIITVDFAGKGIDMEAFRNLADEYGLWLMEDACHAPGAYFLDSNGVMQKCGSGRFADLTVFSFHPVKHIATGEGGMITTNNKDLYHRLLKLRSHGITRDKNEFLNESVFAEGSINAIDYPGWYMEMQELGYNYRITDFQAALGKSQLKKADMRLARRIEVAKRYDEAFNGNDLINCQLNEISKAPSGHAYHLYIIQVEDRLGLYSFLRANDILTQVHYIPVHLMPYYRGLGWKEGDMPAAERFYRRCLSIPIYPTLLNEQQDYVINRIKEFIDG